MRIEKSGKTRTTTRSGGIARSGSGAEFKVDLGAGTQKTRQASPTAAADHIGPLLAMQVVDEREYARKKNIRRGNDLLDTLEAIKADLLGGQIVPERLTRMMSILAKARGNADPELDQLLDHIELRARVELAKLGRFPSF
jgi:hypothetical protein